MGSSIDLIVIILLVGENISFGANLCIYIIYIRLNFLFCSFSLSQCSVQQSARLSDPIQTLTISSKHFPKSYKVWSALGQTRNINSNFEYLRVGDVRVFKM